MEKKELKEAHCPILKQTTKETSSPAAPVVSQNSSVSQPVPEERRVAFDIGEPEEAEVNKERKVAFNIGDSDDTEDCHTNGKLKKTKLVVEFQPGFL